MTKYTRKPRKEELYRLYVDEFNTAQQIADIYGVSETAVYKWLESFGINRRSLSAAQMKGKIVPTTKQLYTMYIDNMETLSAIGDRYTVNASTVSKWLDKVCIKRRTSSEAAMGGKRRPDKTELYRLYVEEFVGIPKIAKMFGCADGTVYRWMVADGINRRPAGATMRMGKAKPSRDELYRLYIDNQKTLGEIGEMFETNRVTIRNWLKSADIEVRSMSEVGLCGTPRPSDDELKRMYIDDGMTTLDMADSIGVAFGTVNRWLKKAGVPLRQTSEIMLCGKLKPSSDELYKLYIEDMLSTTEISTIYNISSGTVLRDMRDAGIKARTNSESQTGELSCRWKGGISKSRYCNKWTEELRERVRDKFDRKCFICGMTEEENGKKLSVHHTNSGKMCMCDYSCELVPLCIRCHSRTIHNRFYWYSLIMCKLLSESSTQFLNIVFCI